MERGQLREAQAALEYALELAEHGAAVTDDQRALCLMRHNQVQGALQRGGAQPQAVVRNDSDSDSDKDQDRADD